MDAEEITKALHEQKELYEALLQAHNNAGIALCVLEGPKVVFANDAACAISGYSKEELFALSSWLDLVHPEYRAIVADRNRRRLAGEPVEEHYEISGLHKDGHRVELEVSVGRLPLPGSSRIVVILRNITQRKRMVEVLRESEQRFENVVDSIEDVVFVLDHDQRHVRLFGRWPDKHRFLGKTAREILGSKAAGVHESANLKALAGEHVVYEWSLEGPRGTRHFQTSLSPLRDAQGNITGIVGVGRDITSLKLMQDSLWEAQQKYRTLIDSMSEGLLQVDNDDVIQYANDCLCKMFQYSRLEVLGKVGYQLLFPEENWDFIRNKNRVRQQRISDQYEIEARKKSGEMIWVQIAGAPLVDTFGNVAGSIAIITDVTDRKKAEQALRESEDRYRDLVEHSNDLICTHDLDGNILSVNPLAAAALGLDVESMCKMNLRDVLAPEVRDQFDQYLVEIKTKGLAKGLMRTITRTGERRIWEYHNTLRTEGVSAPIVRGMAHDITERFRAQKALQHRIKSGEV